jgi:mRNA interferase YafQ
MKTLLRNPISGTRFERDVKLARKRGKDMAKLREAISLLIEGCPLPPRYRDHPLGGDWQHFRDCHIEPDLLLIYKIDGENLHLVRTGTHSDIF